MEISKKNAAFSKYMNFKVLLLQLVPSFLIVFNSICQGIEVGSKCLSFLVYNSVLTFEVQQYEFSPSFFGRSYGLTILFGDLLTFSRATKICKVYTFLEGHKILRNVHLTFDCMYCSQM